MLSACSVSVGLIPRGAHCSTGYLICLTCEGTMPSCSRSSFCASSSTPPPPFVGSTSMNFSRSVSLVCWSGSENVRRKTSVFCCCVSAFCHNRPRENYSVTEMKNVFRNACERGSSRSRAHSGHTLASQPHERRPATCQRPATMRCPRLQCACCPHPRPKSRPQTGRGTSAAATGRSSWMRQAGSTQSSTAPLRTLKRQNPLATLMPGKEQDESCHRISSEH